MKITLKYPIPISGNNGVETETNELNFVERIKLKHLKSMPDGVDMKNIQPKNMIPFIASIANIPVKSAEEIDLIDMSEIGVAMELLMGEFQKTGKSTHGQSRESTISPQPKSGN